MSMYTSGAAIVCRAANGIVATVDVHFNRVVFGAVDSPEYGARVLNGGDLYRLETAGDGGWGDWVALLGWDNVSHPYVIDRLVVSEISRADGLLVHFSIGGDPEPPEHGSETETVITRLGDCPVGSALIDAGIALYARVCKLTDEPGPLVWDDETMWLKAEEAGVSSKAKPLKPATVDFYMVIKVLPPKG